MQASHRRGGVFMFASVVIGIIVLIIAIIVYVEYKMKKRIRRRGSADPKNAEDLNSLANLKRRYRSLYRKRKLL
jgi:hypothetical protein